MITAITYGTRGDVQPFVALGRGLKEAGFTVRIAAPAPFAAFVTRHGLGFAPLPGDPAELSRMVNAVRPWEMLSVMFEFALPLAEQVMHAAHEAGAGSDMVLHTFATTHLGHEVALANNAHEVGVQLFPVFAPTSAYTSPALPPLALGGLVNRLTHSVTTTTFRFGSRAGFGVARLLNRNLPRLHGWPYTGAVPLWVAVSPHVLPRPADWPPYAKLTGYLMLADDAEWQPPDDLHAFLDGGPPPVFVGFGSMISERYAAVRDAVLAALRERGQRVILHRGWGGEPPVETPDDLFPLDSAPFGWLFPRMAAIVHHGGAGTTATALRAGVPSVVMPFIADQFFWAQRVEALGVGAAPAIEQFGAALAHVLTDEALRARATALGAQLTAEDGVGGTVARIARMMNGDEVG